MNSFPVCGIHDTISKVNQITGFVDIAIVISTLFKQETQPLRRYKM